MAEKDDDAPPASRLLPPSPFHLAVLAALLGQRDGELQPDVSAGRDRWTHYHQNYEERHLYTRDAMVKAARFYMLATGWYDEFSHLSDENLHTFLLGSKERLSVLRDIFQDKQWLAYQHLTVHRLYVDKVRLSREILEKEYRDGLDPVRFYLREHAKYFEFKKTDTVLYAVRKFFHDHARRINVREVDVINEFAQKVDRIAAELDMPAEDLLAWRFSKDRRRPLDGDRVYENFLSATEIRGHEENAPDSPEFHGKVIGWKFTEDFLEMFVPWRIAIKKQPGGLSSIKG